MQEDPAWAITDEFAVWLSAAKVAEIAVISHGSSKAPSIFNAIRLAKDAVDNQVLDRIKGQYQKVAASANAKGQAQGPN